MIVSSKPSLSLSPDHASIGSRAIAKAANEAAVTRLQQRIDIDNAFSLIDTPGMLWPNIINESSGYRLAATGAIRQTAYEEEDVASFVIESLLKDYPSNLQKRYGIDQLAERDYQVMEQIARLRGCVLSGGRVDLNKVSRLILTDLRHGDLGAICLETPAGFNHELIEAKQLYEQKKQLKETRRQQRKGKKKR